MIETHGELWFRWTWLKAYLRGMPLGYRRWRHHVDGLFAVEAMLREGG